MPTATKTCHKEQAVYTAKVTPAYARELHLIEQAKAGCRTSMGLLLEKYSPLLWKFVLRTKARGCDPDDLYQYAAIIFMRAVKIVNLDKSRLITYLYAALPNTLSRHARMDGVIKGPAYPTENCKEAAARAVYGVLSFNREDREHHGGSVELDIPYSREPDPAEYVCGTLQDAEDVRRGFAALAQLPERWQDILHARLQGEKLDAIAARLGVSRERVRQIEKKSWDRIRTILFQTKVGRA